MFIDNHGNFFMSKPDVNSILAMLKSLEVAKNILAMLATLKLDYHKLYCLNHMTMNQQQMDRNLHSSSYNALFLNEIDN